MEKNSEEKLQVGKVKPHRWQRFVILIKRHPLRSLVAGIILLALLIGVAIGIYYFWFVDKSSDIQNTGRSQYISELLNEPVPEEPYDQIVYYSEIGQNYVAIEKYGDALIFFLKAQEVVDQNNLNDRITFYGAIADAAAGYGDQQTADEYSQKAEDYLKQHGDNLPEGE